MSQKNFCQIGCQEEDTWNLYWLLQYFIISPCPEPINQIFGLAVAPNAGSSSHCYIQSHHSVPITPILSLKKVNSLVATKIDTIKRQVCMSFLCLKNFQARSFSVLFTTVMFLKSVILREPSDVTPPAVPEAEVAIKLDPAVFTSGKNMLKKLSLFKTKALKLTATKTSPWEYSSVGPKFK